MADNVRYLSDYLPSFATQKQSLKIHAASLLAIKEHAQHHFGPIAHVWSNISFLEWETKSCKPFSELPLSIIIVAPTPKLNFYKLITCGLSDFPMLGRMGNGEEMDCYGEFIIGLHHLNPFEASSSKLSYEIAWMIRILQDLIYYPMEKDSWLWYGHTLPLGKTNHFRSKRQLSHLLIHFPMGLDPETICINLPHLDHELFLLGVFPIYKGEYWHRLTYGSDTLFDKLLEDDVSIVFNPNRKPLFS